MSTHPLEEMESYPSNYKRYNFVLSSPTFHYALEQALQTVNSIDELVVICASETLEELKSILPVEKTEEEWKVKTNLGLLTLDVEEEIVDRVLAFQKIVEVIEPDIERTVSVVMMNYCLADDENVQIISLEKAENIRKELNESVEFRQIVNELQGQLLEKFGMWKNGKKEGRTTIPNPLLEHALNNLKEEEK